MKKGRGEAKNGRMTREQSFRKNEKKSLANKTSCTVSTLTENFGTLFVQSLVAY